MCIIKNMSLLRDPIALSLSTHIKLLMYKQITRTITRNMKTNNNKLLPKSQYVPTG